MKIEETSIVKAPIQVVWDFLLDPEKLAFCVPGCENVEVIGDNSYLVTEAVKIGPISARFGLKVTILETRPPNYLFATMEGNDSRTSSPFNAKITINLESISDSETQANYVIDAILSGVLGKYGAGIIRKKAGSLAERFAEKLRSQLEV